MSRKMLLAFVAGIAIAAGAVYSGGQAARAADEDSRFLFRYRPGVLHVAAVDDGGEPGEPGDGGSEPGDGGGGEPSDPGDGGSEYPPALPTDIELSQPVLTLLDHGFDGYAHPGDILAMRAVVRNGSPSPAKDMVFQFSFPIADEIRTITCDLSGLASNASKQCYEHYYLTAEDIAALGEPDSIVEYKASASLVGMGGETFPENAYRVESNRISFMLPGLVTAENVVVSSPTLSLLDANDDGNGNAGETVRMTFTATNVGSDPADLGFVTRFPASASGTQACDFTAVAASSSSGCQVDFVLSADLLESLGEPGDAVSVDAVASLVSVNGLVYGEGEYPLTFAPVTFGLPLPELAAYLRMTLSGGWELECQTDWDADFVSERQDMFYRYWSGSRREFQPVAMAFKPGFTSLVSLGSYFRINATPMGLARGEMGIGAIVPHKTDPRLPAMAFDWKVDGRACGEAAIARIVTMGDMESSYTMTLETVEYFERIE
ncbi:hypothetical protein [uncultured Nitratireductor sp.]|uniref:hypothetical protein n=1 Tax=uncultured Nitratireductor sp. TaxID=520953 RepID=UPI0026010B88|nr:hypothetical protein [uncultured Nitratireductor sp.]